MTNDNSRPNRPAANQPNDASITVPPDQAARAGFALQGFAAAPVTLTHAQKQLWRRQEAFLEAYRERGTILHAGDIAGIDRHSVYEWRTADNLGFVARFDEAVQAHADRMERVLFDVAEATTTTTNPAALIFTMKGLKREKYGDRVLDTDARDSGRTIASEVRAWRRRTVVEEEVVMEERSGQRRRRE